MLYNRHTQIHDDSHLLSIYVNMYIFNCQPEKKDTS